MTDERKRASSLDLTGFTPRSSPAEVPNRDALANVIEETPFKSRVVDKPASASTPATASADAPKRGRRSRGKKGAIYANVLEEHYERLQRICEDKGWSTVTAVERAIDALGRQEGID